MTKTEQTRILTWRLKLMREASASPRNVAQACRHFGLSRQTFYKWKARFEAQVVEAEVLDAFALPRLVPRCRALLDALTREGEAPAWVLSPPGGTYFDSAPYPS